MQQVRIEKLKLHAIVQKNRDTHRALYEKAYEGYREECLVILRGHIAALEAGDKQRVQITESAPEDHTPEYGSVLRMLELSEDPVVTLDTESFNHYVMDNWRWKTARAGSNAKYLNRVV